MDDDDESLSMIDAAAAHVEECQVEQVNLEEKWSQIHTVRMEYQTRIENTASSIRTILNRMEEIELVDENGLTWQSDFSLAALMKHNLTETKNCEVDDEGIGSWMEQKKRILDVCDEISHKESQLKFQLVNLDDFLQDEKGYIENRQSKKKMIDDLKEKLCFLKEMPPVS